ncbi:hypothetical protein F511_11250 [Dorcoceras hygrometricum]|uniref:DNA-directed RNA polymerase V subunit 1 n=1 Tax=Dorcoceras hygrometricum TaxID=472368 RepID=A0A2Z7DIP0_9LAMI|nr:hypothetical protein F511_11250 [Dorcoceras hygrometricum]
MRQNLHVLQLLPSTISIAEGQHLSDAVEFMRTGLKLAHNGYGTHNRWFIRTRLGKQYLCDLQRFRDMSIRELTTPFDMENTLSVLPIGPCVQISGQSTTSVLGKCVCLVTLAMSLFDLQDVCIAMGSLATLDLPMVVDLIGVYGLKGPYNTLTTTDWFLQALSVIPRGSWGDVARRFTMIRWADPEL